MGRAGVPFSFAARAWSAPTWSDGLSAAASFLGEQLAAFEL